MLNLTLPVALSSRDIKLPFCSPSGFFSWASTENVKDEGKGASEKYAKLEDEKEDNNADTVVDIEKTTSTLRDINLEVKRSSLTCIVGLVGEFYF